MEEEKGKRKAPGTPDGPVSSSQTVTKDTPEALACPSSEEAAAADVTPSSAPATATKKAKREEEEAANNAPKEELMLEWVCYSDSTDWDDSQTIRAVSVDELIQKRTTLANCTEALENEKDDSHNRDFVLKLVRRKSPSPAKQENGKESNKSETVLALLNFSWWEDSAKANLMHFNIMSKFIKDIILNFWCFCACHSNAMLLLTCCHRRLMLSHM